MESRKFKFGDRVKVLQGKHQGKVGKVAQAEAGSPLVGVRFGSNELEFYWTDKLVKLKATAP